MLGEKYGYANMQKFVAKHHLTAAWKELYDNVSFPIPSQSDVNSLRIHAKISVINGTNLKVSKALPLPRGRPVKKLESVSKDFMNKDLQKRRHGLTLALCATAIHTRLTNAN